MFDFCNCDHCGVKTPYHLLDGKPKWMAHWFWRRWFWLLGRRVTMRALVRASDRGEDFIHFECEKCYGHCWDEGIR